MRIGIDIDDTISFTNKKMIEEALLFDENYVNGKGFKNKNGETFLEMFYWNVYHLDAFLKSVSNAKFFLSLEVKGKANEYITKLYNKGHEIIFITRRRSTLVTKMSTKKWLKINGFKYNKIAFGMEDKGSYCKNNNIDLFIDNDYKNVKAALDLGIDSLLMIDDYNKNLRKYKKVKDWQEIYDYIDGVN